MTNRILTICAAVSAVFAAEAVGTSVVSAQTLSPPGTVYSPAPQAYPPYPGDTRAQRPADFDTLGDDEGPNGPGSTALPPPGPASRPLYSDRTPVMSPDDPRYGRPMTPPGGYSGPVMSPDDPRYGQPAGSQSAYSGPVMSPDDPRYGRPMPSPGGYTGPMPSPGGYTGPVMSPDDPRYGRTDPPPVIYANQPPGSPAAGDDQARPPGAVGSANPTGAAQPPQGPDKSVMLLPPEEQPESGPVSLPPNLRRQEVAFATKEPAGTIIVDTPHTYLYYVLGNGRAIRYGVRVGRDGFTWNGVQKITRKAEWPDWHPPPEMIDRQPYLPRFMAGGPGNPLGARAMYLGSTVYRIHGTNQPSTIGKFVSSGCIGMLNEDVEDLFDRAKVGTRVVVWPGNPPASTTTTASAAPVPGSTAGQAMTHAITPGTSPATAVPPLPPAVTVH